MVDITQKPFFHYNDAISPFLVPLQSQADVQFLGLRRVFSARERLLISCEKDWAIDFYTINRLYRYGIHERPIDEVETGFFMWDHMPNLPQEICGHARQKHNFAHVLFILVKHQGHLDTFSFATKPGNSQINNFYLNQKNLFIAFMENFYHQMAETLTELSAHRFMMPGDIQLNSNPLLTLSPRQKECAILLTEGDSTKEIAQKLSLSPRTVEYHIDAMREKLHAKNRIQLIHSLKSHL